ncbi:MAG TPA: RNA 2',3'-cyclic phosphodiesterase [Terracidiphilus sp.]|nr:RNA 2',3'-cyclic phosphodiesterase [Terracidiphilus sp.]
MRLFVGIPLADEVRGEIAEVVAQLRRGAGADDLRWSAPEGWHITLQFLGSAGDEQLECLKASLAQVRSVPVPVGLGALGSFERAGVVFVDVEVKAELAALQQQVVAATSKCGFVAEERPFHPHITLARAKGRNRFRGVPAPRSWGANPPKFSGFEAGEFLLYESFTEPAGSRYEVRGRFALGEG